MRVALVPMRVIVERVSSLAREAGVYVIFGLLEPHKGCIYNSALLIGRNGKILLKHRKFQEPMKFCTGNTVRTAETEFGKVVNLAEEVADMGKRVALIGVKTFIVNSFGGAWVFDDNGNLLTGTYEDKLLIWEE